MKKHIFTTEEVRFLKKIKTTLRNTKDGNHVFNEVCIFLAGFSHGLHLRPQDKHEHGLIIDLLKEFLIPRCSTGIIHSEFWFIQKNSYSKKLFYEYMNIANSMTEKSVLVYGLLMGYPKTACIAFAKDTNNPISKRKFVLNFGSGFILDKVYPNLQLMNCVYSKKHWQAEYKEVLEKEICLIEQLPKLFPLHHKKKSKQYIDELLKRIKTKNLFSHLHLDIKTRFLACESGKLNYKEQLNLIK